jgi:hypothetical protein
MRYSSIQMRWRTPLLVFAFAVSLFARDRIAYIEFFGYQGFDTDAVRKALPFREGDKIPKNLKEQARTLVKLVTGRDATDVDRVCCNGDGDSVVFIGLPGSSSQAFTYSPAPKGDVIPPRELTALYSKMNQAEDAAFKKGIFEQDGSPGYRLSKEPGAHTAQLALREYALHNEDEIIRVLESSGKAEQRRMAADALGYGARTTRQMAALVHAARDPDSGVRNNSTRALGEILEADPSVAAQIPPDNFIDMIRSGTWTDRNKSSMVLWPLTQSRDPKLLARLKSQASDALLEMARWRTYGWSYSPRVILARIAGVPEERIDQLAEGPLDAFLAAIGR